MSNSKTISREEATSKPWSPWHKKLHETLLEKPEFLPKGASLLLSISGGKDSMTLLRLFIDLQRIHKWHLEIWHGDHGWHTKSSLIANELGKWCEQNNLSFHLDKSNKIELKNENLARNWRYENLLKTAKLISKRNKNPLCEYIVTGHTASDKAETLILNLARGANLAGLGTLKETRIVESNIKLVRPLLNFSTEETEEFCKKMNLPVWIDPTNEDTKLSRNKIRKKVLPVLEELYPGCSLRISSLSERLGDYNRDQDHLARLSLEVIKESEGLNKSKLINIPINARSTILAQWLKENGVPEINAKSLKEISKSICKNGKRSCKNLASGWEINIGNKLIKLERFN